jgi:hypothetical protein
VTFSKHFDACTDLTSFFSPRSSPSGFCKCASCCPVLPPRIDVSPAISCLVSGSPYRRFARSLVSCFWLPVSTFRPPSRVLFLPPRIDVSPAISGLVCGSPYRRFACNLVSCVCLPVSTFRQQSRVLFLAPRIDVSPAISCLVSASPYRRFASNLVSCFCLPVSTFHQQSRVLFLASRIDVSPANCATSPCFLQPRSVSQISLTVSKRCDVRPVPNSYRLLPLPGFNDPKAPLIII